MRTHVGARRVTGLGMSARIETLLLLVGTRTARNLYLLACADKMDRRPRAHASSVLSRLNDWLADVFDVSNWIPRTTFVSFMGIGRTRGGVAGGGFYEFDIEETRMCNLLDATPKIPFKYTTDRTFYSYAEECNDKDLRRKTYNFVGVIHGRMLPCRF